MGKRKSSPRAEEAPAQAGRPLSLAGTRIIYDGDCLEQLRRLSDGCVDLIYIDSPLNGNRNYEVFRGEAKEKRGFADRHAGTQAHVDHRRLCCAALARVLKAVSSLPDRGDSHHRHGNGRRTLGTD